MYKEELKAIAQQAGISLGKLIFMQLSYVLELFLPPSLLFWDSPAPHTWSCVQVRVCCCVHQRPDSRVRWHYQAWPVHGLAPDGAH